jgi:hypothetical protein
MTKGVSAGGAVMTVGYGTKNKTFNAQRSTTGSADVGVMTDG